MRNSTTKLDLLKAPAEPPHRSRAEPSWRLSRQDDIARTFVPGPTILKPVARAPGPTRGLTFTADDGTRVTIPPEEVADFLRARAARAKGGT